MATVRRPGSIVDIPLECDDGKDPEEKTYLRIKVLSWDEWKRVKRRLENITMRSSEADAQDSARRILGIALVGVKNLKLLGEDGKLSDFELQKAGEEITEESMALLMPFQGEILAGINKANQFGVDDIKN